MEGGTTAASSALPGLAEEKERSRSVEARKAAFSLAHGLTPISLFSEKDTARRRGPFSLSVGPAKDKLKVSRDPGYGRGVPFSALNFSS